MSPITIKNREIEPGEEAMIRFQIAKLPSGTNIKVKAFVYRAEEEGPCVLLSAGMHGDEINGVDILQETLRRKLYEDLERGTVIVMPLMNIYGFLHYSREMPDGKDVNRSFPGNMKGSLASRLARTVYKKILPKVDMGIDFHSGSSGRYNFPQMRYTRKDEIAKRLGQSFGAPYLIPKSTLSKSMRQVSKKMDIPILIFEGGEALRYDGYTTEIAIAGIQRFLFGQDMLSHAPEVPYPTFHLPKSSWIRAPKSGLFKWSKYSGNRIFKGEPLGYIYDPYGQDQSPVKSTKDGFIIGHNNAAVVNQGDALFHVGYSDESS